MSEEKEDLLADLEDLPSDEEYFAGDDDANSLEEASSSSAMVIKMDSEDVNFAVNSASFQLLQSKAAKDVLEAIAAKTQDNFESKEDKDDSYRLVVSANQLAADIDGEMHLVHKHVRDLYCKVFPELEGLVPNASDYIRTVKAIGRNAENVKQINSLDSIISASQLMMVVVAAATTSGKPQTEADWNQTEKACDYAFELENARKILLDFVTSRMNSIAPNLSVLVGSSVAARLMGSAGGLLNLSRMPAGNVPILGSVKRSLAGFSTSGQQGKASGNGYLYQSDLVLGIRPDLRVKAQRILAGKCALVARVDYFRESPDGSVGRNLREDIGKKLEKLVEPPPLKKTKALPAPLETVKKRRGGRRARRMKEQYAVTELRKMQNRVAFGEPEQETMGVDASKGLGLIASQKSGKIRAAVADTRLSSAMKRAAAKKTSTIDDVLASGSMTSISFTPAEGVFQLKNPAMAAALADESEGVKSKYFGKQ